MRRRLIGAILGASLILAQPAMVAASAWSLLTYWVAWPVPGASDFASVCGQSGIVDVATNYMQTVIKHYASNSCAGSSYTVPSGWIGSKVNGYKDGTICGQSSIHYSTVNTSAWQLWQAACSNPPGVQTWKTHGYGYYLHAGSTYYQIGPIISPNQPY